MIQNRLVMRRSMPSGLALLSVTGFLLFSGCNSPNAVQGGNTLQLPAAAALYPASTPSQVPGTNFDQGLWATAQPILQNNCASCHGSANGPGGVSNITEINQLVSSGLVIPGDPADSPLFQAINSGRMPPTGPLSSSDIQTISNWIQNGFNLSNSSAPAPSPTASPSATPTETLAISAPITTPSASPTITPVGSPSPGPMPVASPAPTSIATMTPMPIATMTPAPGTAPAPASAPGMTVNPQLQPPSPPQPNPRPGSWSTGWEAPAWPTDPSYRNPGGSLPNWTEGEREPDHEPDHNERK